MGPIACPETVINFHNFLRNNPDEHSSQCVCGVAHYQYSLSQQSRSLVANSLRESTYCALTRTSIGCCTTMCRVNQNGLTLVQKDNCHRFFFVGVGGVKQENWETSIVSILPDIRLLHLLMDFHGLCAFYTR